ncbi:hypothetical protein [Glycomyces rhizosphaerae]|uniref:Uncharacterized protein n=1 Tax=Glycomyces rhizosphaerae TaxID=2054422 RepID=A0ABV7PXF4_9ACTN
MSFELAENADRRRRGSKDDPNGYRFAAVIGGRRLYYEAFPSQARFRITMARAWEQRTEALGSVIRLDTIAPGLRVCAPTEVEWANQHAEKIIAEAVSVWKFLSRGCEG